MLVAGGHLEGHPVTLVAGEVHCEITTVSGTAALTTEENRNPVPGAAGADSYTVYLPSPEPLQDLTKAAAAGHSCLSYASPPTAKARISNSGPLIDHEALRQAVAER